MGNMYQRQRYITNLDQMQHQQTHIPPEDVARYKRICDPTTKESRTLQETLSPTGY